MVNDNIENVTRAKRYDFLNSRALKVRLSAKVLFAKTVEIAQAIMRRM